MPKGLKGYKHSLRFIDIGNTKKQLTKILEKYDLGSAADEWLKYARHPISHSAFRLTRILSPDAAKLETFYNRFAGKSGYSGLVPKCVIVFTPNDPDKLRVYPNLVIDFVNWDSMLTTCPYINNNVLSTSIAGINSDMDSAFKSKAWSNFASARKKLKKYEDMDVARALSRYTKPSQTVGDATLENIIRNIADDIIQSRKPVELTFANTPKEFLEMYSNGPSSCMVKGGNGQDRAWEWMLLVETHPTALFAHHPYTRGCYIKGNKGTVRARTILYIKEDGREYYGRLYGSTPNDTAIMKSNLEAKGINRLPVMSPGHHSKDNSGHYYRSVEFDIPGINVAGRYWMPWPYLDNLRGYPVITFNTVTHAFHIKMHNDGEKIKGNHFLNYESSTRGAIAHTDIVDVVPCPQCGRSVDIREYPGNVMHKETGARYCTLRCIENAGYVVARESLGNYTLAVAEDCIKDVLKDNKYYTTLDALKAHGGMQFISDPNYYDEVPSYAVYNSNAFQYDETMESISFRDKPSKDMFIKRIMDADKIMFGNTTEMKKIEIDLDALNGYIIKDGEIPDQLLWNEDVGEQASLWPSFKEVPQGDHGDFTSYITKKKYKGSDIPLGYAYSDITGEYHPKAVAEYLQNTSNGDVGTLRKRIRDIGLAAVLNGSGHNQEDEELAMAA